MYGFLFNHLATRVDPERAHYLGMMVIRAAGLPGIRALVGRCTAPPSPATVHAMGLTLQTPFGLAAGFDKNAVAVRGLAALGFGHVEIGTVTDIAQEGNPRPRLFRLTGDRALINRMGFNNAGARAAARRLARLRRGGVVIGANIGKSRVTPVEDATADYVRSARALAPVADYLAVNVSSPNTPGLRGLQAVETLRPLLVAVKEAAENTPLLVKIAPDLVNHEIMGITELTLELGLAGLIATNTTISREGLRADLVAIAGAGDGGLSGAPLAARSNEVLRLVREAAPDPAFTVISVGGVETADDVSERLDAGATLVQGYTGFIYRGPLWARQINRGIARRGVS